MVERYLFLTAVRTFRPEGVLVWECFVVRGSVDNTVEKNSGVFSRTRMRYLGGGHFHPRPCIQLVVGDTTLPADL